MTKRIALIALSAVLSSLLAGFARPDAVATAPPATVARSAADSLRLSAPGPSTAGRAERLPGGFRNALVREVSAPTALAFLPDGSMLIASQPGVLYVLRRGALSTALNIARRTCSNSERGLLGVAVDPAFARTRHIYAYYTARKYGNCDTNTARSPVNRVSRWTLSRRNVASREKILINNIPSPNGNHNGGDVQFGKDGKLYITVGDGGCDYRNSSRCAGENDAARDRNVLLGKVLRINKDGSIPRDNPYTGANSGRCNATGRTSRTWCRETYAWGLRNPFRIAFNPNVRGTRFFTNDVGQNRYEEVDLGKKGADYGWYYREGLHPNPQASGRGPGGYTAPLEEYDHDDGCSSITGGAFVPKGAWPSGYDNSYLYGDFVCGKIFRRSPAGRVTTFATELGAGGPVHMTFNPFAPKRGLYYTTYANGGQVRRIYRPGG